MGNWCSLCGSNTADANSTTTSSSISSLSSSSSTPGTTFFHSKTPNGKSSSGGYSQFTSVRTTNVSSKTCVNGGILPAANLKIYSFADMKAATNKFRSNMILGAGGFGAVFQGWINHETLAPSNSACRMKVAIKKLNSDGSQGFEQWQEDKELLLVYEFMQKGSLENHLFRRSATILSWDLRLKILKGAAQGLAFLHTTEREVIYRDFKASNILLDASDVYGFGVVLLEILTGLRAIDVNRPNKQQNLVDWKKPMLSQKKMLKSLMDARMEGQYSTKAALQAAQLALRCLENEPGKRPSMREVVEILEEIEAMEGKKPKDSK
nr:probable serine/threonine-protein kinase Cx32, chloroplastic [Ipomoea batatas]